MEHGERGALSHPWHTALFRRSVDVAVDIGARLGTRLFNATYGHRLDAWAHVAEAPRDASCRSRNSVSGSAHAGCCMQS